MKLIDADRLKEYLDRKYSFGIDLKFMLFDEINNQPTAYDIDKVVEELEYCKSQYEKISLSINDEVERRIYIAKDATMYNAIEIVKQQLKENK